MNESMTVVSAILVLALTALAAWVLARFLVWRDGLRSRHSRGRAGRDGARSTASGPGASPRFN